MKYIRRQAQGEAKRETKGRKVPPPGVTPSGQPATAHNPLADRPFIQTVYLAQADAEEIA